MTNETERLEKLLSGYGRGIMLTAKENRVIFDPLDFYGPDSYRPLSHLEIYGAVHNIFAWCESYSPNDLKATNIHDHIMECYQYPCDFKMGGTIDPDSFIYHYPEDPDLYPLAIYHGCGFTVACYLCDIVAFQIEPNAKPFAKRLD